MTAQRFDALVIGAGIGGATAAAHLAPRRRVAILETEAVAGHHSTGRSAAIWIGSYGTPDAVALTLASRDFFERPPPGFAEAPLARRRAVLHLAPPEQRAALDKLIALGAEEIAVAEARALVPAIRPDYAAAAAIERDCFDLDVAALHAGYLRDVRRAGGVLALRSAAGRIWRQAGLWHAEARDARHASSRDATVFAAPVLVNAAGAWGDAVAAMAGVRPLGLQPMRRTAAVIDPAPYRPADWPLVGDAGHGWYARPEAGTRLMLSPADEHPCDPHDVQPEEIDVAVAVDRATRALDLDVRRVEHRWAGLRTFTPDRGLAIGASEAEGFFWNCGQGGYGIQTAPAAGRLLAALVEGDDPGALAAVVPLVDPRRFQRANAA